MLSAFYSILPQGATAAVASTRAARAVFVLVASGGRPVTVQQRAGTWRCSRLTRSIRLARVGERCAIGLAFGMSSLKKPERHPSIFSGTRSAHVQSSKTLIVRV